MDLRRRAMEHARFTTVAHRGHRICNPLGPAVLEHMLVGLGLVAGDRVIDVGCGKAALLVDLARRRRTAGGWVSSDGDWDRYEGLYADTIEDHVAAHPGDPDAPAMLERIRRWRETYRRWGRDTPGSGLYLFRRL